MEKKFRVYIFGIFDFLKNFHPVHPPRGYHLGTFWIPFGYLLGIVWSRYQVRTFLCNKLSIVCAYFKNARKLMKF